MHRMLLFLAAVSILAGCTVPDVRYREDVAGPHPDPTGNEFVRYDGYADVAGTLEASITTWRRGADEPRVRLVGAVHIGDRAYYDRLQTVLDEAELVLFELVKPEALDVREVELGQGDMYAPLADLFGLESQVRCIDYTGENFRWLDMSAEQFSARIAAIAERARERLSKLIPGLGSISYGDLRAIVDRLPVRARRALASMAPAAAGARTRDEDPIGTILRVVLLPLKAEKAYYRVFSTEKAFEDKYKHTMAAALGQSEALDELDALRGQDPIVDVLVDAIEELWQVLLVERNQIVLDGIEALLAEGDAARDVAVFYGAGHFPGIAEGLRAMGFEREGEPAWMPVIDVRR